MKTHISWLSVIALFCSVFTLVPLLRDQVIGDRYTRDVARPYRDAEAPITWESQAAQSLHNLGARVDRDRARFGIFVTSADPQWDMFCSVYPSYFVARRQMLKGQLPLWNPHVLMGTPLMGGSMVQPLSPYFWLSLLGDRWFGFMWMLFVEVFACAASFYGFFVFQGRSKAAAAAAALAFVFTGELLVFFPYGTVVGGFAFVPWILLISQRFICQETGNKWAWATGLSLCTAGQWVATNLQFAVYATALEFAWIGYCSVEEIRIKKLRIRRVFAVSGATVLGVLISAAQLFPVLAAVSDGGRDPGKYSGFNRLDPELLLTALFPSLLGDVNAGSYAGGILFTLAPSSAYVLTFGALVWMFVFIGTVCAGRRRLFWLLITYGPPLIFLAANLSPIAWFFSRIPGFMASHGVRALVVSAVGAAVLAADGMDALVKRDVKAKQTAFFFIAAQAITCVGLIIYSRLSVSVFAAHLNSLPLGIYLWSIAPCAVVLALVYIVDRSGRFREAVGPLIALVLCIELYSIITSRIPYTDSNALYAQPLIVKELIQHNRKTPGRFLGLTENDTYPPYQGDNLIPNIPSVFGLWDIRGFVPVPNFRQELVMAMAENPDHATRSSGAITLSHLNSPWLDRASARYVMTDRTPEQVPSYYRLLREGSPRIYENPQALPLVGLVSCAEVVIDEKALVKRVVSEPFSHKLLLGQDAATALNQQGIALIPCGEVPTPVEPVRIRREANGGFDAEVRAPAPGGYLRIAQSFVYGFRAHIGEAEIPVMRADYALQFVPIPAGQWKVRVRYKPQSLSIGTRLSLAALGSVVLLSIAFFSTRNKA